MQIKTSADLDSEVQKRKTEVDAGTVLYYHDGDNFQKWEVIEIFEAGFIATDRHEEKDFFFDELQIGWTF